MYAHELNEIVTNQGLKTLLGPLGEQIKLLHAEVRLLKDALAKARVIQVDPEFISAKAFGAELGYTDRTIQKWCAEGRIDAIQVCESGKWRIPASELERFKRENSLGAHPRTSDFRITG